MSFHSDMSSKKSPGLRRDGRSIDFFGKKIKSEGHSSSSLSPVRKDKSPKLRSKSRERPCSSSSPIQAKKVTFYRNGDSFFKGVVLAISNKIYPSIDSLILDANRHPICDVSVLPKEIRYVFSTDGNLITSLDELQEGKGYVFSSTESFKPLQYGGVNPLLLRSRLPAYIQHDVLSCSPFHREESDPLELTVNESCDFIPSRTIYVIRAGPRPRYTTKMTLKEGTNSSLGQVIDSMEQDLFMCKGGIKHLCSVSGNEDLVLHMLTRNPKLRCKASDVFNHSWLQTKPSHLRSSFCSPRKAYEERTSSPDHETRHSLSSQSAPSCSDSDQSLFKLSASPKGYRYISCPSDVGASQNDVVYGDTNRSQSSLDRDSLPTDRTIRHSHVPTNIESSGFDFGSSQLCTDQSKSQPCVRVGVDSVKSDAASGKFDLSHFSHDISASALRGTTSSISDIFSVNSVSTENTSSSDRRISAVKQPCSASTQTTSSELLIHPAVHQLVDSADIILSSSSSATAPTVVELPNGAEVTYPSGMTSPCSRFPFPLSLFFSTIPSASPVIQHSPAQHTTGCVNTDYQLMTAQMCSASLNGSLSSGHDSSSGRFTNAKSTKAGSASSSVHPAHIENCILLPEQSSTSSDGQTSSPPVLAFAPPKPLSPAFNYSDLPMLQFASSTKSAVPPKLSQLKQHAPSSPPAKSSLLSNLPIPQHSTHTYQQNQPLTPRSFPQYASDPVHDLQHIQTLTRSSIQSSQAPMEPSNISEKMLHHGFSSRPKESNFHPVHRHRHSVNHASTSTGVDQSQLTVTHASPSQMLTAALKAFDPEDQQGHVKDARLSSGNQKPNMNMAKVAVETVCWTSSSPQKSLDKEQTGKSDVPSTSPARNKDGSPASSSSSSSHDEFLSPSSSMATHLRHVCPVFLKVTTMMLDQRLLGVA